MSFERVFELDSLSSADIEKKLIQFVPGRPGISSFYQSGDLMTAKIEHGKIDYKRFGNKWGGTCSYFNFPLFANVAINIKDGKYRVIVTNMIFKTESNVLGDVEAEFCTSNMNHTKWTTSKVSTSSAKVLQAYLSDLFAVKPVSDDW